MAQFIKVGERFINMDKVELVDPREDGLLVGFGEGNITLRSTESEEMAYWLARYAQDVAAYRAADESDPHADPDARMEHYFTEATAAELKAPVWHPE